MPSPPINSTENKLIIDNTSIVRNSDQFLRNLFTICPPHLVPSIVVYDYTIFFAKFLHKWNIYAETGWFPSLFFNKGIARHSTFSVEVQSSTEKIKMSPTALSGGGHLNLVII